jgi:hypothetical protein
VDYETEFVMRVCDQKTKQKMSISVVIFKKYCFKGILLEGSGAEIGNKVKVKLSLCFLTKHHAMKAY